MTKQTAWHTMYLAYSTPRGERMAEQYYITFNGLCHAPKYMDNLINPSVGAEMVRIISGSMVDLSGDTSYAYNDRHVVFIGGRKYCTDPANDFLRADFCYLQYIIEKYGE